MSIILHRYITKDELKQALSQHGVGDDATIAEIIADVDSDHVCNDFSSFT